MNIACTLHYPVLHRNRNVQTAPGTGSVKSGLDLGAVGCLGGDCGYTFVYVEIYRGAVMILPVKVSSTIYSVKGLSIKR